MLDLNFSFEFWPGQPRGEQARFAFRYILFLNLQPEHLANAGEGFQRSDDEVSLAAGRFDQDFRTIAQPEELLANSSRQGKRRLEIAILLRWFLRNLRCIRSNHLAEHLPVRAR